ncbi:MAG TPA: hypothetical protein VFH48_12335 [Chloroflexota bacterium]|nr:hypothetical protein [Chloroflexota bacterium]
MYRRRRRTSWSRGGWRCTSTTGRNLVSAKVCRALGYVEYAEEFFSEYGT